MPLPSHVRGVGGRSARKAGDCGAAAPPPPPLLPPRGRSAALQPGDRTPALALPACRRRPAHARCPGAAWRCAGRRGCAEDTVVHSSPGDAVDCTHLRLAWVVSARPRSPCSVGVKRDRQSTYWLWTGAAEAGEARERWREQPSDWSYRRGREESRRKKRLNWQILRAAPRARAAVEDSQATGVRRGREQSRRKKHLNWQILLAVPRARVAPRCPTGCRSSSLGSCALLLIFGDLCPAFHCSRSQPADSPFPARPTSTALGTTAGVSQGQGERRRLQALEQTRSRDLLRA
ncbi:uncharacterized protein M6G45_014699 [Spheniscus humboldti]